MAAVSGPRTWLMTSSAASVARAFLLRSFGDGSRCGPDRWRPKEDDEECGVGRLTFERYVLFPLLPVAHLSGPHKHDGGGAASAERLEHLQPLIAEPARDDLHRNVVPRAVA